MFPKDPSNSLLFWGEGGKERYFSQKCVLLPQKAHTSRRVRNIGCKNQQDSFFPKVYLSVCYPAISLGLVTRDSDVLKCDT